MGRGGKSGQCGRTLDFDGDGTRREPQATAGTAPAVPAAIRRLVSGADEGPHAVVSIKTDYVPTLALSLLPIFTKALLMSLATTLMPAVAASAIKAANRAYSIKS